MRIVTSFSHALWAIVLVGILAPGCSCPQPAATSTPQAGSSQAGDSTGEPATPTTGEPATPSPDREPAPDTVEPGSGEGSNGSGAGGEQGGDSADPAADKLPERGMPCLDGACAKGLTCVEYYGIAGPRGPKFTSCETPCAAGRACPDGLACTTIADGPGQVCRPR